MLERRQGSEIYEEFRISSLDVTAGIAYYIR